MVTVDSSTLLIDGPWQHRFVSANGARFHVALAGPDEHDAPLVLLLHAVPQYWWAWRHQLVALAAAGHRVAAMDLRGTGASDKPPLGYDIPTLAADVAGVARSLGAGSTVVVGAGTGGDVAWAMPALHPRITVAVGALGAPHPIDVHRDPRVGLSPRAARHVAFAQLPSLPERAMTRSDLVVRLLTEWGAPGWLDPATGRAYRDAMRVPFAAHCQLEQLRWLVRSTPRTDGRRFLAAMRQARAVPALQLHGTHDGFRPVAYATPSRAAARVIGPDYRYEQLTTAGHFLAEEAPEQVTALLLGWLAAVARG